MEQVFKDNPKLDVAYKTTDGRYFFLESDAINHANSLEDKKVKKLNKPQEENTTEQVVDELEPQKDEKKTKTKK